MLQTDKLAPRLQDLRPVYPSSIPAPASTLRSRVSQVEYHITATGEGIVLWDDILLAFKYAQFVERATERVPFLKDSSGVKYVLCL